jgi:cytochrome P450
MMLTWSIWELMNSNEYRTAVIDEVDELIGVNHPIGQALPSYRDIKKGLRMTENVLKETTRKWSVVPVVTRYDY